MEGVAVTVDLEQIKKDQSDKLGKMVEKFLNLLGKDPELQAMMPDPSVAEVFKDENLPLERRRCGFGDLLRTACPGDARLSHTDRPGQRQASA